MNIVFYGSIALGIVAVVLMLVALLFGKGDCDD